MPGLPRPSGRCLGREAPQEPAIRLPAAPAFPWDAGASSWSLSTCLETGQGLPSIRSLYPRPYGGAGGVIPFLQWGSAQGPNPTQPHWGVTKHPDIQGPSNCPIPGT